MSRSGFHYRQVSQSFALDAIVQILAEASGPMTSTDIYEEAKKQHSKLSVGAIPTCIDEIRRNTGYDISPGTRFPDGKYYYWLKQAPGWRPRWTINPQFRIVAIGRDLSVVQDPGSIFLSEASLQDPGRRDAPAPEVQEDIVQGSAQSKISICLNPACKKVLPNDPKKVPVCNEACRIAWKESIFGSVKK